MKKLILIAAILLGNGAIEARCYQTKTTAHRGQSLTELDVLPVRIHSSLAQACATSFEGMLSRSLSAGEVILKDDIDDSALTQLRWSGAGNRLHVDIPVSRVEINEDSITAINAHSGDSFVLIRSSENK